MKPLASDRIVLREFVPSDADDVFAYASDVEVTQWMEWPTHRARDESLAHVESCREAYQKGLWYPLAIFLRSTGRVVGSFDLRIVAAGHRVGEIGYVLAKSAWGLGLDLEAGRSVLKFGFDEIGLNRIQAICTIENRSFVRAFEELGLTREGTLREYRIEKGVVRDKYMYSILRREWRKDAPVLVSHGQTAQEARA